MIFVVMEKGKNDMARYTDIDKLIAEYDRVHIGPAGGARKLMVEAPIANVVPREEFEKLKVELAAMCSAANSYKILYQNLAKEIFEDIDDIFLVLTRLTNYYAEIKEKHTEGER
jgi:hypothetical protein